MEDRAKITFKTLPEMLGAYAAKDAARFHMPGHKGRGMGGFWRGDLIRWDVTELSGTDNLHAPADAILRAERNMAEAYGARASFFVVNGSTAAVQAMLLSLDQSDKLLLSRDAHRCAISGAALSGIYIDYILPEYDAATGMWGMVTPETLDRRLTETHATAVLLTSPNYYGLCADIETLSHVAHAHGALLFVDGAHGAHFPFSDALPPGLTGYADMWSHSQHKTMDALTQAASLHMGDCRILPETVRRVLRMIETSSPSYLLMASLDWSVYMAKRQDWTGQVARIDALRKKLTQLPGLRLLPERIGAGVAGRDRTRLVIDVTGRGMTGYAAAVLLEQSGIYCEMADSRYLVLITTPEDDPLWYARLLTALQGLPAGRPLTPLSSGGRVYAAAPQRATSVREAAFSRMERAPLLGAAGRIAGEAVGVYPPGIALTMPGERILGETVAFLLQQEENGARLFGVENGCVSVVKE